MSLVRTAKQAQVSNVPPGTYQVRCMEVAADVLDNPQFGTGDVIRFDLEVVDKLGADGNPLTIDAIANDRLTPKSKLWGWLEAFGITPEINGDLDIEEVVGREALARIVQKEGSEFTRVDALIPLPTASKSPAKATGEPDFDAFWKQVRAMGKEQADVKALLPNGNMLAMQDMKGDDLVALIEKLSA